MTMPPTLQLGPYLLVRPVRNKQLRIYQVFETEHQEGEVAVLWKVEAPEFAIPAEWRIRCLDCPEKPSPSRAESVSKAFYDRDKALKWLRMHRDQKHPRLEAA